MSLTSTNNDNNNDDDDAAAYDDDDDNVSWAVVDSRQVATSSLYVKRWSDKNWS